jgi:hypothetical protein
MSVLGSFAGVGADFRLTAGNSASLHSLNPTAALAAMIPWDTQPAD